MVSKKNPEQPAKPGGGIWAALAANPWAAALTRPEVLAALLYVLAFAVRYSGAAFRAADAADFRSLALARDVARGDYFQGDFDLDAGLPGSRRMPPLYPALIAAGDLLGADPEMAGAWISLLAGSLAVFPIFFLGAWIGNRASGFIAGLLYCFLPASLAGADAIGPEPLFILLTALTLWLLSRFLDQPSLGRLALAAVTPVLAALTKNLGMGYPVILLLALTAGSRLLAWNRRHTIMCLATAAGMAALALLPYLIWIKARTGEFQLSPHERGLSGFYIRGEANGPDAAEEAGAPSGNFNAMAGTIPWPVALLALLGLVFGPKLSRAQLVREFPLWLWAFFILAAYATANRISPDPALFLPAAVPGMVWAGRAMALAPGRAAKVGAGTPGLAAVGLVMAGAFGFHVRAGVREVRDRQWLNSAENWKSVPAAGQREAAADVAEVLEAQPGAVIVSAHPYFAYYLEGRHQVLGANLEELERQAGSAPGAYLVLDSFEVRKFRPGLKMLVTASDPLAGAGLVFRRYYPANHRLVSVYQAGAKSISLAPDPQTSPELLQVLEQGKTYFDRGYFEHSRQLLEAVLARDPKNAAAHFQLMLVYLRYGEFDEVSLGRAEDELMRYAFESPSDPDVARYRELIKQMRVQHRFIWGSK